MPTPQKKPTTQKPKPKTHFTPHLALRFTDTQIQLAESTSNHKLKNFATQKLPPNTIDHGEIKNPEVLKTHLDQLLKAHPPSKTHLTIGIPDNSAFIKVIDLPGVKESEISDTLSYQVDNLLPLKAKHMYFDWAKLPNHDHKKHHLLLAALPRKITDDYLKGLESTNLTPLDIETTSLTLARLAQDLQSDKPLVLIDAEPTITALIFEPPSSIILTSVTPPTTSGQPDLAQAQKDLLQMINFYQKKHHQAVSSVILAGQFAPQLKSKPLVNLPHQLFPAPKTAPQTPPAQLLTTALAQKPIAPPRDPHSVNLLPSPVQSHYDQAQNKRLLHQLSIIIITTFALINLGLAYPLYTLARKNISPSIPPPSTQSTNISQDVAIKNLNQKLESVNQILQNRSQTSLTISQLSQFIPQSIIISSFSLNHTTNRFSLHGFAPTRQDLITLKNQLPQHPHFSEIKLPLSSLEKTQNINFSLSGTYNPIPD
jgi:hypothetical protein